MEYEELPPKVRENVPEPDPDDPGPWQTRLVDAGDIDTVECAICGDDLYLVPHDDGGCWHCGAECCWVNDHGELVHGEGVSDPAAMYRGYNLALEEDDDASGIMCGYCEERFGEGNSIVIVAPDGETFGAAYEGNVVRDNSPYGEGDHESLAEAPDEVMDILKELVLGGSYVSTDAWRGYHTGPNAAGELTKVSGGWHSSMERSDFSERVNELTSGEFHRGLYRVGNDLFADMQSAIVETENRLGEGDEVTVEPDSLDVPVAVMFGRTSNVMSIGIDVYAPEDAHAKVEELLDETAAPAYAGV